MNQKVNEIGNVYDVVFHDYSNLFNKLNKVKNFLRDEFIYGGHWLSIGGSAFAISIMLMLNTVFRWELIFIVYLLCLIVYNFDHYINIEQDSFDNPNRTNHLRKYQKFFPLILTIYSSLFIGLLFYFGNFQSLSIGILILIIGLLYSLGLKKLTKKIIGFKNFYTSLSVSSLVILVSFHIGYSLNLLIIIVFLFIFLRVIINTSFCDLKDIRSDKKKNLITLPIYLGKEKFLTLLHILNIISILLIVMSVVLRISPLYTIFLVLSLPCVLYYLYKAKNPNTDLENLSSGLVDGEFILWPLLLFGGQFFITLI